MALNFKKPHQSDFVSTNLRFPRERLKELRIRAAQEGISLAELVREAVDAHLGYARQKKRKAKTLEEAFPNDPFFKIIGRIKGKGHPDGSVNHDKYIYDKYDDSFQFHKNKK